MSNFFRGTDQYFKDVGECPLFCVPGFDLIKHVVLDSMHLIYLGKSDSSKFCKISPWIGGNKHKFVL